MNQLDSKVAMTRQAFDRAAGREAKGKAITQTESLATLVCVAIKSSEESEGSDLTGIEESASITARLLDWQQLAGGSGDGRKRRPITLIIHILVFVCAVLFGAGEKQPPCSRHGYITGCVRNDAEHRVQQKRLVAQR